jgi:hypothetical protein
MTNLAQKPAMGITIQDLPDEVGTVYSLLNTDKR